MRKVVIIEDHELMRSAIASLLGKEWKIAGTAGTLEEARTLFKNMVEKPDIVILDIELGKDWGLDIIADKTFGKGNFPPVLVYSAFNDYAHVNAAIRTGAKGFVCKDQSSAELLEAMEDVTSGKISFPHEMIQRHAVISDKIIGLSKKEHKIFTMVQKRKTNKQIAAALGVTLRTIENNLSIIYDKTGVKNRKELENL